MSIKRINQRGPARVAGLIFILVLLLAACTADGDTDTATAVPETSIPDVTEPTIGTTAVPPAGEEMANPLANTEWTLTSFGPVGQETAVLDNTDITLVFAPEGQAGGSSGCNSFSAEYTAEGTSLQMGEIISTLVACTDNGVADQEAAYFDALRAAIGFELTDDQLMIFYDNGQSVLNFTRGMPAAEE